MGGLALKRTALRPSSRKAAILEVIESNGSALVETLALEFGTSVETIRRDLNALADSGSVRKVHGGAVRASASQESAFGVRAKQNTLAKQLVAEKLAGVVSPGQSMFMDTGTTTLACAAALAGMRGLFVVTNSVRIADALLAGGGDAKVTLLGGAYHQDNAQTLGPTAIAEIAQLNVEHAILTVGTLDERGAFDFSEDEALVARAMINAANKVTVVADSSKLHRRSTFRVCELNQIDRLILDKTPDKALGDVLRFAGVEVI